MNKTILTSVFMMGTALILATTMVCAQDRVFAANIPFDFNFGDVKMPSGKYMVRTLSNGYALAIRSADNQKAVTSITNAGVRPPGLQKGGLVFHVYGDQYFLSTVSWSGGPTRMIPPTSVEIQIARNSGNPKKLEIAIK